MGTSDAEWPKNGRPPKKIDWKRFEKMCAKQWTKTEICLAFNMDPSCLEDKLRAKYGQSFTAVFRTYRMDGLGSLRSKQQELALKGDKQMLLLLDKKYAHMDEHIDPRCYGGNNEAAKDGDHKVDINVSFAGQPEKCVAEAVEIKKIKDAD